MVDFIQIYKDTCQKNDWSVDPDQLHAMQALQEMSDHLLKDDKPSFFPRKLFSRNEKRKDRQGVYMFGDVGRGKSFVMDLFFDHVPIQKKTRQHFYQFMADVHDHMHEQRQASAKKTRIDMNLLKVAQDISKNTKLLCFDEMFVEDVADAMLLGRLFTALFEAGVYIVMTSNIHPDDLYKEGLQRDRFIPFIELLKHKMNVVPFDGDMDYRLENVRDCKRYLYPADAQANERMRKLFLQLSDGQVGRPYDLEVKKRHVTLPHAAKSVVMVSFTKLCSEALGAGDYLALADRFSTLILLDIPKLDDKHRNDVRRFMTLIDTLYESGTAFFATAALPYTEIYTGKTYKEPFARTVSRLAEMQSADYL